MGRLTYEVGDVIRDGPGVGKGGLQRRRESSPVSVG